MKYLAEKNSNVYYVYPYQMGGYNAKNHCNYYHGNDYVYSLRRCNHL